MKNLLKRGADVNYVRHVHPNAWYSGDTHTALYDALHASLQGKDEKVYVDVIELLLKSGAQTDVRLHRGTWAHSSDFGILERMEYLVARFKDQTQKIRFVKLFIHSIRRLDLLTIMGSSGIRSKMK